MFNIFIKSTIMLIILNIFIFGQQKEQFDINFNENEQNSLFKQSDYREGKTLSGEKLEYSILNGGYFTIGTTNGFSNNILDDNCQLSYGHPYSLTSFIKIFNDGKWYSPTEDFELLDYSFEPKGDTLKINIVDPGNYQIDFSIFENNNSRSIKLKVEVTNLSSQNENFKVGYILDPALGKWGDGFIAYNNEIVSSPTIIDVINKSEEIKIFERQEMPYGLSEKIILDNSLVKHVKIDNWRNLINESANSSLDMIYDLGLEIVSKDTLLSLNKSFSFDLDIELIEPHFGSLFLRADFPTEFSLENNLLFPENLDMFFELYNSTNQHFSDLEICTEMLFIDSDFNNKQNINSESKSKNYANMTLPMLEFYEDEIISIKIDLLNNQQIVDTYIRNIFVPAIPISDTGLVISIDTLMNEHPKIGLKFNVKNEETGSLIFNIKNRNIKLYQNNDRVEEFHFMKDTSGGTSNIDVAFVLDVTGSMGNEIQQVKSNIIEFADSLQERGYNYRLGLVTFLDNVENIYDFTDDAHQFKNYIEQQTAHGGGDYPENSLEGLMSGSQLSFRNNSNRIIIWITDASYHTNTNNVNEVVNALLSTGITTHCIGNNSERVNFYDPITVPTGGDFYNINGNFRDILLDISRQKFLSDYLISFNTDLDQSQLNSINLEIHHGGLGGTEEIIFQSPSNEKKLGSTHCYPNPFNPVTNISISKPLLANGVLEIFNIIGQKVKSVNIDKGKEVFEFQWNGSSDSGNKLSSGVYILNSRLFSEGKLIQNNSLKLMLLK